MRLFRNLRRVLGLALASTALWIVCGPFALADTTDDAVIAARQVMDDFMSSFNARDEQAWAETFHYPHIRIASGEVRISEDVETVVAEMDFDRFAEMTGWNHSAWDSVELVHADETKVHFAVAFTRYDAEGEVLQSYKSLYVVTKRDRRWGIQVRSSFAP